MRALAALLCALSACAAADDDPVEVLARVRDKVLAHAEHIPNHTCVETIVRNRFTSATAPPHSCDDVLGRRKRAGEGTLITLASTDRLRLDVAIADSREIYSWAGAAKFEEKEIDEIVPAGAIGTGPFAATLLGIFNARDPRFAFEGETTVDGRRMMEFSFEITQEQSNYKVRAGKVWLVTGYTGTLLVDPARSELVRLSVRTEELGRATGICEVTSTLEYGMVQLGTEEYLLPKVTRERFIEQDGAEDENRITFSACREFRGQSTVTFGGQPAGREKQDGNAVPGPVLPAGLPVAVDMVSQLSDESAAGDRIEGRLVQPIVGFDKQVLVPAGATLQGRLVRVEAAHGKTGTVTIVLRWETMEIHGEQVPVYFAPDRRNTGPGIPVKDGLQQRVQRFILPRAGEERYAAYQFQGEHLVVRNPLRSLWLTLSP